MGTTIAQKIGLSEKQADTIKKIAFGVGTAALGIGIFALTKGKGGNFTNKIKNAVNGGKAGKINCTVEQLGIQSEEVSRDMSVFTKELAQKLKNSKKIEVNLDEIQHFAKLPEKDINPEVLNKLHEYLENRPGSGKKSAIQSFIKEYEQSNLKPSEYKELMPELNPELQARIDEMLHSGKVTTLDTYKKFIKKA